MDSPKHCQAGVLECGSEARGICLGIIQGSLRGWGWGAVPRNLPSPVPCPPPTLFTQASACFSCHAHSCNSSCPSGFHGNNCSVLCECPEGPCHPVSGACQLGKVERRVQRTVTRERLALYMDSRGLSLDREAEPTSETFPMPEICVDQATLGPPEDVTESLPPEKPG